MTTCAAQDVPGRECLWCAERSDTVDFSQSIKASVVGCDLLAGGRLMCPAGLSGLIVLTWLAAYLDECGRNGAKPLTGPALERFLPWNASPDDLHAWATPPRQPG